jgi:SAM-dependent methyltransferase
MSHQIIRSATGLHDWFQTPPGQYLLGWERDQFDGAVADIFGYHAVQLGLPDLDTLQANRMPHRWLAVDKPGPVQLPEAPAGPRLALATDFAALPFPANSLDLVVLPHALELNPDPHATLREVERVLVPEGRVVICGLNPASLWGLRQRRAQLYRRLGFGELFLPLAGEFIGYWRLRDWLRLLGFEVESGQFGCYRPAVQTARWLDRFDWMDPAGERWWPIFGAVYFVVAVKRVRGMKLLSPAWSPARVVPTAPVSVANRSHSSRTHTEGQT